MSPGPVAITGMGAVTPLGIGAEALHANWQAGISGLDDGPGLCRDFNPADLPTHEKSGPARRFVGLALMACGEAVETAWSGMMPYPPERVACVLGCAFGGTGVLLDQYQTYRRHGRDAIWAGTMAASMANAAPAALAIQYGLRGEAYAITSACAASAHAICDGLRKVQTGVADAAIVGGAEAPVTDFLQAAFLQAGALSPSGICRPFDRRRDGFVMAEGAGVLVIEDRDKAMRRGATIFGHLAGGASTTEAGHLTAPQKSGETCALAIRRALADAGVTPDDVDYINAHGTSTPLNDRAETVALKSAFGSRIYDVPVSAPKSVLGHSIGAAGAIEAIATVQAIRYGVAPPTVGLEEPEDGLDLNYVPGSAVALRDHDVGSPLIAISNSFAFGGHDATVVLTT